MKKLFALMIILLAVLFAGCIFDGDDDDNNDNGDAAISAAGYFPLNLNAFWTRTATGDGAESETYTDTVTMASEQDGKEFHIVDCPTGSAQQQWYRVEEPFIYRVYSVNTSAGRIRVIVPYLDFGLEENESWTVDDATTGTYLGLEDVTVPAGTFKNSAKFQLVNTGTSTTTTFWIGKNVGFVKETVNVTENGQAVSTTTTVLDEYDISGAVVTTYTVSGAVTDGDGAGVAGVDVTLSDIGTVTTDANGEYTFSNVPRENYVVTPAKEGMTFSPETRSLKLLFDDLTGQNFTAAAAGE